MRKRNKGFTLIEIVVVIAIIAVLSSVIIISLNPMQATAAKQAASHVEQSLLTAKQYAMTRSNSGTYLDMYEDADGRFLADWYVDGSQAGNTETLSGRKVSVSCTAGKDAPVELTAGTHWYVTFDKGSGACRMFGTTQPDASGTATTLSSTDQRIITIKAGGREYRIEVSGVTGRISNERV